MHKYLKQKYYSFIKNFVEKDLQGFGDGNSADRFKGQDIKKIRKNYNLSQRCFAAMLDISVKTLQNYEIDRYSIPGTARSLFIFTGENVDLFKKYYLKKIDNLEPYRESVNSKTNAKYRNIRNKK